MNYHDYRYNEMLETNARKVITQYNPALLYTPSLIPIEEIMERVYGLLLDYQHIRKNGMILGQTVFRDTVVPVYDSDNGKGYTLISVKAGTVLIDASLLEKDQSGRLRFTYAHELAHWVIDRDYFERMSDDANAETNHIAGVADTEFALGWPYEQDISNKNRQSISLNPMRQKTIKSSDTTAAVERQANRLASRILMPKCTLRMAFHELRHKAGYTIIRDLAKLYAYVAHIRHPEPLTLDTCDAEIGHLRR